VKNCKVFSLLLWVVLSGQVYSWRYNIPCGYNFIYLKRYAYFRLILSSLKFDCILTIRFYWISRPLGDWFSLMWWTPLISSSVHHSHSTERCEWYKTGQLLHPHRMNFQLILMVSEKRHEGTLMKKINRHACKHIIGPNTQSLIEIW